MKTQAVPEISTRAGNSTNTPQSPATLLHEKPLAPLAARAAACISQGIKIRGEITGSEDLFVDGDVEGSLALESASVTIGPNGKVKADVVAREVIVRGCVEGKVHARERVQVWATGQVHGEIQTLTLAIEEGAVLRGKVEAGKPAEKAGNALAVAPASVEETSGSAEVAATPAVN
ncbi:MAG: polymer-forming cytoskeletal protein [Acidobacteriia bacterium]|nr:polymer-forming cytoskeletal protein [Terriglobia bacterium]